MKSIFLFLFINSIALGMAFLSLRLYRVGASVNKSNIHEVCFQGYCLVLCACGFVCLLGWLSLSLSL